MGSASISDCKILRLRGNGDARGKLTYVEAGRDVPFEVRRLFYLHDVPPGAERGGHAHRLLHQGFIAIAGAFAVVVDDGREKKSFRLDDARVALHVPPSLWVDVHDFSPGAVCLVLASAEYDEADYIRDRGQFVAYRGAQR